MKPIFSCFEQQAKPLSIAIPLSLSLSLFLSSSLESFRVAAHHYSRVRVNKFYLPSRRFSLRIFFFFFSLYLAKRKPAVHFLRRNRPIDSALIDTSYYWHACACAFAFLTHSQSKRSQTSRRCLRKQSRARRSYANISVLGRCLSRATKLFEICQGLLFASLSPSRNDALSQVMLWPYLLRRYKASPRRNSRRGTETVHRCRPIPAGRPPRPFADLIYGAILMPKNTMHRPRVPPRDSTRFLAFPDSLALARFFIVSSLAFLSLLPRSVPSPFLSLFFLLLLRRAGISRARTPTERVSPFSMARDASAEKSADQPSARSCARARTFASARSSATESRR